MMFAAGAALAVKAGQSEEPDGTSLLGHFCGDAGIAVLRSLEDRKEPV